MKLSFKLLIALPLLVLFPIANLYAQQYKDTLDVKINALRTTKALPGFSAIIVNMDGILYENTQGYADIEHKIPFTNETVQCIASTTKTTIALAIMKLKEEGRLSLESPINDFLPFEVTHPFYIDSIIRIKHLVTHTSGIQDTGNNYDLKSYYFTKNTRIDSSRYEKETFEWLDSIQKNDKLSLETYFTNIFSEKGEWYDHNTFHEKPFASHYKYTNVGAGLMAYIIECITGISFDDYIEKELFEKLRLNNTNFDEEKVPNELLAKSYQTNDEIPSPSLGFINYPDGGMHTNIKELSRYLIEMIKGYNGQSDLLTQDSFKEMMSPILSEQTAATNPQKTFDNIGVFWQLDDDGSIKHYGGNPLGGTIYFSFNPNTNVGRILMTNCDARASREKVVEFISIWETMDIYGTKL